MAEVIWAPSAVDDVDAIAAYISRDSVDNARLFVHRLITAAERLGFVPYSGRVIPEIGKENCRQVICGAYRIMYSIKENEVWITGVVHGARDWRPE
jgi:toxin ParE1/3/4